jgi:hypothetical protein
MGWAAGLPEGFQADFARLTTLPLLRKAWAL